MYEMFSKIFIHDISMPRPAIQEALEPDVLPVSVLLLPQDKDTATSYSGCCEPADGGGSGEVVCLYAAIKTDDLYWTFESHAALRKP